METRPPFQERPRPHTYTYVDECMREEHHVAATHEDDACQSGMQSERRNCSIEPPSM